MHKTSQKTKNIEIPNVHSLSPLLKYHLQIVVRPLYSSTIRSESDHNICLFAVLTCFTELISEISKLSRKKPTRNKEQKQTAKIMKNKNGSLIYRAPLKNCKNTK